MNFLLQKPDLAVPNTQCMLYMTRNGEVDETVRPIPWDYAILFATEKALQGWVVEAITKDDEGYSHRIAVWTP